MQFKNVAVVSAAGVIAALAIGSAGAYAATQIGSQGIENDSLRSVDVKDETLRSKDVKDETLRVRDLRPGAVSKLQGQAGVNGKDAVVGSYVESVQVQIPAGEKVEGTAVCEAGDLAVGGGYSSNDHTNGWAKIYQNRMTWVNTNNEDTPDGWYAQALGGERDADMYVWVTCLS